ncbi:MAG: ribonuclease, partial [Proteobacteria bacterium]|nr:ribonuclease [Pseudomonadota bacterium]
MSDFLYIVDQPALIDFCARLRGVAWIALDTEFIREQTFYPQLCLIQIASSDRVACIDPLALPSLDPLLDLLYDPAITKVLHAAHQDLELFFHLRGAVPAPVFDTQLAALVLGCGSQIGYAALVQQLLGVELDKAHT